MSWISGNCQGNRDWECYYGRYVTEYDPDYGFPYQVWVSWCRDVSGEGCPGWDDGAPLFGSTKVHHGGGW
jgi:hypothetical protein